MKNRHWSGCNWGFFTKSDVFTMETIPNCTKFHSHFCRKIREKLLQGRIFYGILEQNKRKYTIVYIFRLCFSQYTYKKEL